MWLREVPEAHQAVSIRASKNMYLASIPLAFLHVSAESLCALPGFQHCIAHPREGLLKKPVVKKSEALDFGTQLIPFSRRL